MKQLFFILLLSIRIVAFSQNMEKQKPSIDTSDFGKWPGISNGAISGNGKYVSYEINEFVPAEQTSTVFISTPDRKWMKKFNGVSNAKFTNDSRFVVFLRHDTLYIQQLGAAKITGIANVKSFQLVTFKAGERLLYKSSSSEKTLVVKDISTGKEREFLNVTNYALSANGQMLVLQREFPQDNETVLECIKLEDGKAFQFWADTKQKPTQIVCDRNGVQVTFLTGSKANRNIWYYKSGDEKARLLLKDGNASIEKGYIISGLQGFCKDGDRLLFRLEDEEMPQVKKDFNVNVNVWSYKDLMPQSEQLGNLKSPNVLKPVIRKYISVINISGSRVFQLQKGYESVYEKDKNDQYCLVENLVADTYVSMWETMWNPAVKDASNYLISMNDGKRTLLPWKGRNAKFSPGGKYVVFSEQGDLNYYSYEIATGVVRNITQGIKTDLTSDHGYRIEQVKTLIPVAGWLEGDSGIVIYDRNDIWLIDPAANRQPENITNGYGKNHNIIFRLGSVNYFKENWIRLGERVLLAAFNQLTKHTGFCWKTIGQKGDPEALAMDKYLNTSVPVFSTLFGNHIKAKDKNVWLVGRQTASESLNYYWTNDLKKYYEMSDVHPEKKYNWLSSEVLTWRAADGDTLQGVLYKPENFNPDKKYPVLVSYYRNFSDELNLFHKPEWAVSRINIPWFISRGYLVFQPDIHHRVPDLKESVVSCVASAVEQLFKLPFIDKAHIGIHGHSFGGLETGYLVTNTNIFAAACTANGYYDLLRDGYTVLNHGGIRATTELHMGGMIWEKREDYIKNTSFLYLDKVTTPILIMRGGKDGTVPPEESMALFLGLRRLNKVAWMIDYEEDNHELDIFENAKDYTIRMDEFFDHYLKGTAAPYWMTRGIPAYLKGAVSGYALDPTGKCASDCKICIEWNKKTKNNVGVFK